MVVRLERDVRSRDALAFRSERLPPDLAGSGADPFAHRCATRTFHGPPGPVTLSSSPPPILAARRFRFVGRLRERLNKAGSSLRGATLVLPLRHVGDPERHRSPSRQYEGEQPPSEPLARHRQEPLDRLEGEHQKRPWEERRPAHLVDAHDQHDVEAESDRNDEDLEGPICYVGQDQPTLAVRSAR